MSNGVMRECDNCRIQKRINTEYDVAYSMMLEGEKGSFQYWFGRYSIAKELKKIM